MEENKFASCFGWVVAWISVVIVGVFMDGWALSTIWNWFISPIFSLPFLSMAQAIGVAMVFSLFTRTRNVSSDDKEKKTTLERFIEFVLNATFVPLLTVGMAYIVLQFAF